MKHPIWIFNSALASLLIFVALFMFFSRQEIPYREPIEPEAPSERVTQDEVKINIAKIYEQDLFDTYQKELPAIIGPAPQIPMPRPPTPSIAKAPELPKPTFLPPLDITLKGIVVLAHDDEKNRAIIQDNQTKLEASYKVGNMIQDAQLIRIQNNKVIFLRTNGQQEVLYLREKDAQLDPTYASLIGWDEVVKKIDDTHFNVSPQAFVERIQNIAQFIDALDLTTAYQKGKSIGCRVGTVKSNTLGHALGLQTGDIITQVNDIPATDTAHRFQVYKSIMQKQQNDQINVTVLRYNNPLTLLYTLEDFSILDRMKKVEPSVAQDLEQKMKEKQLKAMQQKHRFAPTVGEIRKRERQNMLKRGKQPVNTNEQ